MSLVVAAAQGVEQGVDVGADAQAEERDVVAGVGDDSEVGLGQCGVGVEGIAQPAQEASAADPTGQCGDLHTTNPDSYLAKA